MIPCGVQGRSTGMRWLRRPTVYGVEAVHVLGVVDLLDDHGFIDVRRQRQLHQNAVHPLVGVQPVYQVQEGGLTGPRRKIVVERCDPHRVAGPAFVAHVDSGSAVPPHENRRQPGRAPAAGNAGANLPGNLPLNFPGDGLAIDDGGGHGEFLGDDGGFSHIWRPW